MEPMQILDDATADALLAGLGSPDEELALISEIVDYIRAPGTRPVKETLAHRHVPLLAEAARAAAPAATPIRSSRRPRLRRLALGLTGSGLALKVLAGSVALAAVTGLAVASEGLPEVAEQALARAAELVGIELPQGKEPIRREEGLETARTQAIEHCEEALHPEEAADCPVLERVLEPEFAYEQSSEWTSGLYLEHALYQQLRIRALTPEREPPGIPPVEVPDPGGWADPTGGGTRPPAGRP